MGRQEMVILVMMLLSFCQARDRYNSKSLIWDGDRDPQRFFADSYEEAPNRGDRKVVIINNKAYDLSEEEQSRMRSILLRKGHIPGSDDFGDLEVARPVAAAETEVTRKIGSARFVADPDKQKLIITVADEEVEQLKQEATTTPVEVADRVVTESPDETSTVHYEYTQVSALTYIWQEFVNIGDLLGREVVDSMSRTLWYLWKSVVKFVQARGRRSIMGPTPDL